MKKIILSFALLFALFIGAFAQNDSQEVVADVEFSKEAVEVEHILYVIQVPNNLENKEQLSKLNGMNDDVIVEESGDVIKLLYVGIELTSDIEPDFITSVNVIKGAEASSKYPNAPKGGVIEIMTNDSSDLIKIYKSIKTR